MHLYDAAETDLISDLFYKLPGASISDRNYNYFALAACNGRRRLLEQILFQSTVLGVSLDLNVYIKIILSFYFQPSKKDT